MQRSESPLCFASCGGYEANQEVPALSRNIVCVERFRLVDVLDEHITSLNYY